MNIDPMKHKGLIYRVLNTNSWLYGERSSWTLEDAFQEGMIALLEALQTYDSDQGTVGTYCLPRIKWGLIRAYKEQQGLIRKPDYIQELHRKYQSIQSDFVQSCHREPDVGYMATMMKMTPSELQTFRDYFAVEMSLDAPIGDEDVGTLYDVVSDERDDYDAVEYEMMISQLRKDLDRMMNQKLNHLDREMVKAYFGWDGGDPRTMAEIGDQHQLTYEQTRGRIMKSLQSLRTFRAELTRHYPELITHQVYTQTWNHVAELRRMVGSTVTKFIKIGDLIDIDDRLGVVMEINHDYGYFEFRHGNEDMRYQFTSFRDIEMQDRHIRKLFTAL